MEGGRRAKIKAVLLERDTSITILHICKIERIVAGQLQVTTEKEVYPQGTTDKVESSCRIESR